MKKWYVIHTQTGYEDRVKKTLEKNIGEKDFQEVIYQVLVPTERVLEVKEGKKKIIERKIFPGYVIVEMDLTDASWHFIKNTPGVSGFIGAARKPVALSEKEVEMMLKQAEDRKEKASPKVVFSIGEAVKITEGPFTNFNGTVEEVFPEKGKIKVSVSIFGRSAPVELEYWQVERL